jgi:hypothetical protein
LFVETATQRFVELKAGGPDDPDAMRTATVLDAYFRAEHMRAFRQLLWRRLAVAAVVWLTVVGLTALLSRSAMFVGLMVIVAAGTWAAVLEWRADRRLSGLLAGLADRPAARPRAT